MLDLFECLFIPLYAILFLLVAATPLIIIYLFFRLTSEAFEHVGFSHWHAILMVFGSVLGSTVDIPLSANPITAYPPAFLNVISIISPVLELNFPISFHPITLAVNLGGCIIPVIVSLAIILRCQVSAKKAILGSLIVAAVAYQVAIPVADEGILLPVYVSPTLAAICGLTLATRLQSAPALAYISGSMGTLLGADIFNLLTPGVLPALAPPTSNTPSIVLSIGGAGIIDGIFLTGVFAVLLAAMVVHLFHRSGDPLPTSCAKT